MSVWYDIIPILREFFSFLFPPRVSIVHISIWHHNSLGVSELHLSGFLLCNNLNNYDEICLFLNQFHIPQLTYPLIMEIVIIAMFVPPTSIRVCTKPSCTLKKCCRFIICIHIGSWYLVDSLRAKYSRAATCNSTRWCSKSAISLQCWSRIPWPSSKEAAHSVLCEKFIKAKLRFNGDVWFQLPRSACFWDQ